jgi:hypothetical protein
MNDTEIHKTVEETEHGYRLKVESTRGTGTRDQDKVKAELRSEERPHPDEQASLVADVIEHMQTLRAYDPDEEETDE